MTDREPCSWKEPHEPHIYGPDFDLVVCPGIDEPMCEQCEGVGWIDDPTACGDPEHCSPMYACHACNPDGV